MKNDRNIEDISDEILLLIFTKLNMVDVFYSLMNVNRRFSRLVFDYVYIRDLNMTRIVNINSIYDQTCLLDEKIFSKIFKKVLSHIHNKVYKLTVDQYSIKEVFSFNYDQLYSLSLWNFEEEILYQYLSDNLILRDILSKQITHINIDLKNTREFNSEIVPNIFQLILSLCKKLIILNFCDIFPTHRYFVPLYYLLQNSYMPSTLTKLKINVSILTDCLYLLDGPLVCLSTLIINIESIYHPEFLESIDSTKKLLRLKYFSLTSFNNTYEYDRLIVPLLCRMINLEELKLYLLVGRYDSIYVDGNQLYHQFLIYMTKLNKFSFYIKTQISFENITFELPTNEDIQRSFIERKYPKVASYVYTDSFPCDGLCQIYSLPYDFEYFVDLDNHFQSGNFNKVRQVEMFDTIPFQHKLFKQISKEFPFLEFLDINNIHSQEDNQHSSTLIIFPYLTYLNLKNAHVDYANLFLLKQNMYLPRLFNLSIKYDSLITITNNFTNDPIYFNFDKLKSLDVFQLFVRPKCFQKYFPLL